MKPNPLSLQVGDQPQKAVQIWKYHTKIHHNMPIHIWMTTIIDTSNLSQNIIRFVEVRNQGCNRRGPMAEKRVLWDPSIIWKKVKITILCLNHRFYNNHSQNKTTCIITVKIQYRSPTSQITWWTNPKATQETGILNHQSRNLQHQNSRFGIKDK